MTRGAKAYLAGAVSATTLVVTAVIVLFLSLQALHRWPISELAPRGASGIADGRALAGPTGGVRGPKLSNAVKARAGATRASGRAIAPKGRAGSAGAGQGGRTAAGAVAVSPASAAPIPASQGSPSPPPVAATSPPPTAPPPKTGVNPAPAPSGEEADEGSAPTRAAVSGPIAAGVNAQQEDANPPDEAADGRGQHPGAPDQHVSPPDKGANPPPTVTPTPPAAPSEGDSDSSEGHEKNCGHGWQAGTAFLAPPASDGVTDHSEGRPAEVVPDLSQPGSLESAH